MDDLDREPAEPGSLPRGIATKLGVIQSVVRKRDASFREAFGLDLRRTAIRADITRHSLVEFGAGRPCRLNWYQGTFSDLAGATTVADEVRRLVEAGVLAMQPDPEDAKIYNIVPSRALVKWASVNMPRLITIVREVIMKRD